MSRGMKCPVPVGSRKCGLEELVERKRGLERQQGGETRIVHHECALHRFHILYPGGTWAQCDCSSHTSGLPPR